MKSEFAAHQIRKDVSLESNQMARNVQWICETLADAQVLLWERRNKQNNLSLVLSNKIMPDW